MPEEHYRWYRELDRYQWFVLVVAVVSFLSLVFGELVPKSLALRVSEGYALRIGRPLLWLARAASFRSFSL